MPTDLVDWGKATECKTAKQFLKTRRNEYEKYVLLFAQHCIIDAEIAVLENAKNTAFVITDHTVQIIYFLTASASVLFDRQAPRNPQRNIAENRCKQNH